MPGRVATTCTENGHKWNINNSPPPHTENRAFYGIMWKNIVERDSPQVAIWRMRFACWIPKAADTYSEYVILLAFQLQQWLHERASVLHYTYITCFVK